MTPTTLRAVAASLAQTVLELTPDYPLFQDHPWQPVPRVLDVPGARLRLFCCEYDPPDAVEDGIYGTAVEYATTLRIFTNYRGLPETDDEFQDVHSEIVSADARQLWLALEARQDPVTPGLVAVLPLGWTPEEDEPGHLWGSHQFEVRFLLSHT